MIRLITMAISALLITGCGDNSPANANKSSAGGLPSIKKEISTIEHKHKNGKIKFDNIYKHLSSINKQLPKLNKQVQEQIVKQAKQNSKMLKKVSKTNQEQFKTMQKEINQFGKKMAKAGY